MTAASAINAVDNEAARLHNCEEGQDTVISISDAVKGKENRPEMIEEYRDEIKQLAGDAVCVRRRFHENAELSFQETETSAYLREQLEKLGAEFADGFSGNSIVCYLNGEQDGPTIAFRADIDALPIQEDNDLPFRSKNPGVMHACGHDAHAATLLAMAGFFAAHKDLIRGRIKLIFQQGEELLPGGAVQLCREGVMNDVDEIYAYHASSLLPVRECNFVKGNCTAAVGAYRVVIRGKGGHGGFPHLSNNPILCATSIVNILNQMVTTSVDPQKAGIITTAYILSGNDYVPNVIPGEVIMGGNIRTLDNDLAAEMFERTEKICRSQCEAFGCECEYELMKGYPSTENSGHPLEVMAAVLDDMGIANTMPEANLGAEDFAYYTLEKPASYVMLGMKNEAAGDPPAPHHNPKFTIDDENGIPVALEFMIRCYLKAVEE